MYYRINVSVDGQHLFATAPESVTSLETCKNLVSTFRTVFRESAGYKVSVTHVTTTSHNVEV